MILVLITLLSAIERVGSTVSSAVVCYLICTPTFVIVANNRTLITSNRFDDVFIVAIRQVDVILISAYHSTHPIKRMLILHKLICKLLPANMMHQM